LFDSEIDSTTIDFNRRPPVKMVDIQGEVTFISGFDDIRGTVHSAIRPKRLQASQYTQWCFFHHVIIKAVDCGPMFLSIANIV
jgi:hypothetical protein